MTSYGKKKIKDTTTDTRNHALYIYIYRSLSCTALQRSPLTFFCTKLSFRESYSNSTRGRGEATLWQGLFWRRGLVTTGSGKEWAKRSKGIKKKYIKEREGHCASENLATGRLRPTAAGLRTKVDTFAFLSCLFFQVIQYHILYYMYMYIYIYYIDIVRHEESVKLLFSPADWYSGFRTDLKNNIMIILLYFENTQ